MKTSSARGGAEPIQRRWRPSSADRRVPRRRRTSGAAGVRHLSQRAGNVARGGSAPRRNLSLTVAGSLSPSSSVTFDGRMRGRSPSVTSVSTLVQHVYDVSVISKSDSWVNDNSLPINAGTQWQVQIVLPWIWMFRNIVKSEHFGCLWIFQVQWTNEKGLQQTCVKKFFSNGFFLECIKRIVSVKWLLKVNNTSAFNKFFVACLLLQF